MPVWSVFWVSPRESDLRSAERPANYASAGWIFLWRKRYFDILAVPLNPLPTVSSVIRESPAALKNSAWADINPGRKILPLKKPCVGQRVHCRRRPRKVHDKKISLCKFTATRLGRGSEIPGSRDIRKQNPCGGRHSENAGSPTRKQSGHVLSGVANGALRRGGFLPAAIIFEGHGT